MAGLNKVTLIGNVGKDPDVKYISQDVPVATFTLATSEVRKDKNGEKQTFTEWHNLVVWRGLAKTAEKYVKKGDQLYVEGKIRTRSWDDNGTKKYMTEIIVDNLIMLGRKPDLSKQAGEMGYTEKNVAAQTAYNQEEEYDFGPEESDDLPF